MKKLFYTLIILVCFSCDEFGLHVRQYYSSGFLVTEVVDGKSTVWDKWDKISPSTPDTFAIQRRHQAEAILRKVQAMNEAEEIHEE